MADNSFVRPLAEAIATEVSAIGAKANCGVNNNWLPVVARAVLHGNEDTTMQLIYTMSGPPLPESMQKTPPLNLLLDAVDPTHEMNDDPDTKKELVKIFSKPDNAIDKVLKEIAEESNGCNQWIYALSTRSRIAKFLTTNNTPKPRGRPPNKTKLEIGQVLDDAKKRPVGRPPAGKVWDFEKGAYVAKSDAEGTKLVIEHKRPVGRPPFGKVWDPIEGVYTELPAAKKQRVYDDKDEQKQPPSPLPSAALTHEKHVRVADGLVVEEDANTETFSETKAEEHETEGEEVMEGEDETASLGA